MSRGPKPIPKPSAKPTPPIAPPDNMKGAARDEWLRIVGLLAASRVLSELDIGALTIYATSFAHYNEAEAKIEEMGTVVLGTTGTPIPNPYLQVPKQTWERIKTLLPELGLTPSGRSRLKIVDKAEDEDESGFKF